MRQVRLQQGFTNESIITHLIYFRSILRLSDAKLSQWVGPWNMLFTHEHQGMEGESTRSSKSGKIYFKNRTTTRSDPTHWKKLFMQPYRSPSIDYSDMCPTPSRPLSVWSLPLPYGEAGRALASSRTHLALRCPQLSPRACVGRKNSVRGRLGIGPHHRWNRAGFGNTAGNERVEPSGVKGHCGDIWGK